MSSEEKALLAAEELGQAQNAPAEQAGAPGGGRPCEAGPDVRAAIQRGVEDLAAEAVSQAQVGRGHVKPCLP